MNALDPTNADVQTLQQQHSAIVNDFRTQLAKVPLLDSPDGDQLENSWDQLGIKGAEYSLPVPEDNKNWDANDLTDYNALPERQKQRLQYAIGRNVMREYAAGGDPQYNSPAALNGTDGWELADDAALGVDPDLLAQVRQTALKKAYEDTKKFNYAGYTIQTQEDAQMALTAINDAIVEKDKIRAHLGAAQNRLENTISNLTIQAENLQAAESRISDVDVATEMTEFVRNQILTQSAVAMLSQANSLPQMAMQLIGG